MEKIREFLRVYWVSIVVALLFIFADVIYWHYSPVENFLADLAQNVRGLRQKDIIVESLTNVVPYFLVSVHILSSLVASLVTKFFAAASLKVAFITAFVVFCLLLILIFVIAQYLWRRKSAISLLGILFFFLLYVAFVAYGGIQTKKDVYDKLQFYDFYKQGVIEKPLLDASKEYGAGAQYEGTLMGVTINDDSTEYLFNFKITENGRNLGEFISDLNFVLPVRFQKFRNVEDAKDYVNKLVFENRYKGFPGMVGIEHLELSSIYNDEKELNVFYDGGHMARGRFLWLWNKINSSNNYDNYVISLSKDYSNTNSSILYPSSEWLVEKYYKLYPGDDTRKIVANVKYCNDYDKDQKDDCIAAVAEYLKDESLCEKVADEAARSACYYFSINQIVKDAIYNDSGKKTVDVSVCDKVPENQIMFDNNYREKKEEPENPLNRGSFNKFDCILRVARANDDPNICYEGDYMHAHNKGIDCEKMYYSSQNDPKYCELDNPSELVINENATKRAVCIRNFILERDRDLSKCGQYGLNEEEEGYCATGVSKTKFTDTNKCETITDQSQRDNCWATVLVNTGDVSYCAKMSDNFKRLMGNCPK